MRYAEIAKVLDVPEGTVKSRLFRGRRLLQRDLVGYAVDMGYIKPKKDGSIATDEAVEVEIG
jgi:RNA polymerase sigma-70 factor (ECF subfamily)